MLKIHGGGRVVEDVPPVRDGRVDFLPKGVIRYPQRLARAWSAACPNVMGVEALQKNKLFRTNLLICLILLAGFTLTAIFGYQANYRDSLDNIERVSSLTAEGIYYQITAMFTRPVNTSQTMAHDSLLAEHLLNEPEELDGSAYVQMTRDYLRAYREKYGFDSVFLVSSATGRYYNFNGFDRILVEGDPENDWYHDFMDSSLDYDLNVDNDEVVGAGNEITVFVNCKVSGSTGTVLGVVGVGIRLEHLKELLAEYEDKFGVEAYLIDSDGTIEISTTYNGYESADWFEVNGQQAIREQVMAWREASSNLELWDVPESRSSDRSYIVARYIPELSWHLLVKQNTGQILQTMRARIWLTFMGILAVIVIVLAVITSVIRRFNRQITELIEERQTVFRIATEELYDTIYELNLTKNTYVGDRTREYFESIGTSGLSYDEGLRAVARNQIKEEYREGYVSMFSPENAIREFENGNNHLQYDFMISQDGGTFHWMRIDAYIFYSAEDGCIHMYTYRKNIDAEKQKEILAETDEMTGFYTKKATERMIEGALRENRDRLYAFFIFDIDNFKTANDCFGHAFGDHCIKEFTGIIRRFFREGDILGRVGGDEFVGFISVPDMEWVEEKAKRLCRALEVTCTNRSSAWGMSASIGVAVAPMGGSDFDTLYRNADNALYQTKQRGKNGFTIYRPNPGGV